MIFVDAHVHIYDCFDLEMFLDSAFDNFSSEALRSGNSHNFTGALLLTESRRINWFDRLRTYTGNSLGHKPKKIGRWSFHPTNEASSLWAWDDNNRTLLLVAGCQIVTKENLEVLALVTAKKCEDGRPLMEVLHVAQEDGTIPVIPWGFGKWNGRRGEIIKHLLQKTKDSALFLGDSGNRLAGWARPALFDFAETRGIHILPGSDPLPRPYECNRAGSFGFWMEESVGMERPGDDLKNLLLNPRTRFHPYGNLEKAHRFLRKQLGIWIWKKFFA
jgi:hypothetical protein